MARKITTTQNKIIIFAISAVILFFLFWLFIYAPSRAKLNKIKAELSAAELKLKSIEAVFDPDKEVEENIELLKKRFKDLSSKFPVKEEEGFRAISDLAKNLGVEVVSLRIQPKTDFLDQNNAKTEIERKTCRMALINMELRGHFKDLVKYLEALKTSSPVFTSVERLKVNKGPTGASMLNVSLDLNIYLLN